MITLFGMLVSLLVGSAFLHLAVKIAAGETGAKVSFGKTIIVNIVLMTVCGLLNFIPLIGTLAAIIAGFVIIMQAYSIGFFRALLLWIVYVVVVGTLTFMLAAIMGLAAFSFAGLMSIFA